MSEGQAPDARTHRQDFVAYVVNRAAEWHREHLGHLYQCFERWNVAYFDNQLVPPYLMLSEPKGPVTLGDYGAISGFGGGSEIRIRPSLVRGSHPSLLPGPEYAEGRRLFVEDVALHELVHQYQHEVLNAPESSYKGHGPVFARECSRIGATLGLPPVRPAKARGKDKDLPSCAQWPHNVRPEGYYLGALRENEAQGGASARRALSPATHLLVNAGRLVSAVRSLAEAVDRVAHEFRELDAQGQAPAASLAEYLHALFLQAQESAGSLVVSTDQGGNPQAGCVTDCRLAGEMIPGYRVVAAVAPLVPTTNGQDTRRKGANGTAQIPGGNGTSLLTETAAAAANGTDRNRG